MENKSKDKTTLPSSKVNTFYFFLNKNSVAIICFTVFLI